MSPFFTVTNKKLCCADFFQPHLHVLLPLLHLVVSLLSPLHLFCTSSYYFSFCTLPLCLLYSPSSCLYLPFSCALAFLYSSPSPSSVSWLNLHQRHSLHTPTLYERQREGQQRRVGVIEVKRGHVKLSTCQSKSLLRSYASLN